MAALRRGVCVDDIHAWSKIDLWFLDKIARTSSTWSAQLAKPDRSTDELLWDAKRSGFSRRADRHDCRDSPPAIFVRRREAVGMSPVYKMVDTCAGEFAADDALLLLDL